MAIWHPQSEEVLEPETVAKLVDDLFETRRKPDGGKYSNREVAAATQGVIDATHLGKLRSGKIPNPSRDTLLNLCRFFKVPPSYFFPELKEQLENAQPVNPIDQLHVALRCLGVQPDLEEQIARLVQVIRSQQKS